MERVSIAQLKARLSAYLKRVQAGGSVLVTDRGAPVATLSPITPADGPVWLEMLARSGVLSAPKANKLPNDFFQVALLVKDPKGRLRKALLAERYGSEGAAGEDDE